MRPQNWLIRNSTVQTSFASSMGARLGAFTAVLSLLIAGSAVAQTNNQVSLRFNDAGETITGELLEFANGNFRINSMIGPVTIPNIDLVCIGDACPDGTTGDLSGVVLTLTSLDGTLTVSGNLIEIKDENYVLATGAGEFVIPVDGVNCEGSGCI